MVKKVLISFFPSVLAVVALVIIELGFMDLTTQYSQGDYGWVALWLIFAFFPVLFALPFVIASKRKQNKINDFLLFCFYSFCICFPVISLILVIILPLMS